jgi:hypothetical protein
MGGISTFLRETSNLMSGDFGIIFILAFFTTIIVIYSVFIFYFYRYLAKKNLIELNLNQYNNYDSPGLVKFFAVIFYIIEYIVVLPILTFFWFAFLSILILILAEGIEISTILLVSAALVASVRVSSYINENLSRDLAKMLPFTLLAIAITKPDFFDINSLFSRVSEISSLFSNIPYYLLFIIALEVAMRIMELFAGLVVGKNLEDPQEEEEIE